MTRLKIGLLVIFTIIFFNSSAQYTINLINDSLKRDASAVLRKEDITYTVNSTSEIYKKVHRVISILKKDAIDLSKPWLIHSPSDKVMDFHVRLYDSEGKLIQKLKKSDAYDYSLDDDINIIDEKVKVIEGDYEDIPFTIEYVYEVKHKEGLLNFRDWNPKKDKMSIESAKLQILLKKELKIRYKEFNVPPCKVSNSKDRDIYSWEIKNSPAKKQMIERFSPPDSYENPLVLIAPNKFSKHGYEGDMTTWKSFGAWNQKLLKGRNNLSDEYKQSIRALLKNQKTEKDKIKKLYQHLQKNTRYVSIQLGIGGWQPFKSNYVAKTGYGDCKALSHYMKSMLDVANIKSYYTLINAEKNEYIDESFPSNQFNHAILMIPSKKDTIWLECTSQNRAFGFLGSSTINKNALVIDSTGGHIVKTPKYDKNINKRVHLIEIKLNQDGSALVNIQSTYQGLLQEIPSYIAKLGKKEQEKWIYNTLKISDFELLSFNSSINYKSTIPTVSTNIQLKINHFAKTSGKRLFISPNILSKWKTVLDKKERKNNIYIPDNMDYEKIDSVFISIPENYKTEFIPNKTTIDNQFGKYFINHTVKENKILFNRKISLNSGEYPKEGYNSFKGFLKSVYKSDRQKIVLRKTNN